MRSEWLFPGLCLSVLAPFLRADGNCQGMLRPLAGQSVQFTLTIHQSNHTVSFANGTTRLAAYNVFPQYFSDRVNGTQPFSTESADRLGIYIDPVRSLLTTTLESWGRRQNSIDLFCVPGTSLLRGTSGNSEVSLAIGNGDMVAPPPVMVGTAVGRLPEFNGSLPSAGGRGRGKSDSVDVVTLPSLGVDPDESAATALDALRYLSRSDPDWISRHLQRESALNTTQQKLAYRIQAIDFLAKLVSR
jgi:hypothetical protein